jgi:hypothetical protein
MVGVNCLEVAFHQLLGSKSSTKEIRTSLVLLAIDWSLESFPETTAFVAEISALAPVAPVAPVGPVAPVTP